MWRQGTCGALGLLAIGISLQPGCAPTTRADDDGLDGAPGGGGDGGGAPQTDFDDFPETPVIEPGAPANAPDLFDPPGTDSGGPCLLEPQQGTLLPRDWLRPRFSWQPTGNQNLFEIRLHTEHQLNDLVLYTTETSWTMPLAMWSALNLHTLDQPITVSIRGAHYNGSALDAPPAAGAAGSFTVAPVAASGTIAYWTSNGGGQNTVAFKGFRVGDETVQEILRPAQTGAGCFGCHSSTPDGQYVAFSSTINPGDGGSATVDLRSVDGLATTPPFTTPAAQALLGRQSQQAPVFSPAHWSDTSKITLALYNGNGDQIVWTDLLATSMAEGVGWGVLARQGDPRGAAAVAFSHDGTTVAYSSAGDGMDSGMNLGSGVGGDLYTVPFNGGAGGVATPVPGASLPGISEHYAAFSADDQLLAFIRVPATTPTHDNQAAEVYVVPSVGGTAIRLAANDPASCSGQVSPGLTNSWPKWSPQVAAHGTTRYYWLTFSSRRTSYTHQIFFTPVTIDEVGRIETYPAVHLWNQPEDEGNHTPAWDNFDIIVQ